MIDNPFVESEPDIRRNEAKYCDATVTGVEPLFVRLDGYTEDEQPPTKPPLVGDLAVNDRVMCLLHGRQLVVLGRYGG